MRIDFYLIFVKGSFFLILYNINYNTIKSSWIFVYSYEANTSGRQIRLFNIK